jgi:hypothetical protein
MHSNYSPPVAAIPLYEPFTAAQNSHWTTVFSLNAGPTVLGHSDWSGLQCVGHERSRHAEGSQTGKNSAHCSGIEVISASSFHYT